jgi:ditrans,polycis-polyprenyl diphosphate synthase
MLDQHGVRLNVLGRIEMLPENVQKSVRVAQEVTKNNSKWAIPRLSTPLSDSDDEFF